MSAAVQQVRQTPEQLARQNRPDVDWERYDRIRAFQRQIDQWRKEYNKASRRLGDNITPIKPTDNRTDQQKLEDFQFMSQVQTVIRAHEDMSLYHSADEVANTIRAFFATGKNPLTETEVMQVAKLAYSVGLNPLPGMGEIHVWKRWMKVETKDKTTGKMVESWELQFGMTFGYKGLQKMAKRNGMDLDILEHRPLTQDEIKEWQLEPSEIGAICKIVDFNKVAKWQKINKEPQPWTGVGTAKKGKDYAPNGRPLMHLAMTRALRQALFYAGATHDMPAGDVIDLQYDRETGKWTTTIDRSDVKPEGYLEGNFSETEIEAGVGEVSDAPIEAEFSEPTPAQEGVEVAPESAQSEVKAEEPAPAAAEVVTHPAPEAAAVRDLRVIYEDGKKGTEEIENVPQPKRLVAMLQNVVKPNMAQSSISEAIEVLIERGTLSMVTTEEYRGLLAVINAKPTADELRGVTAQQQAGAEA